MRRQMTLRRTSRSTHKEIWRCWVNVECHANFRQPQSKPKQCRLSGQGTVPGIANRITSCRSIHRCCTIMYIMYIHNVYIHCVYIHCVYIHNVLSIQCTCTCATSCCTPQHVHDRIDSCYGCQHKMRGRWSIFFPFLHKTSKASFIMPA